ncbi:DUF2398 family protein [Mycobacterium avium]|uniref:DUF2398 family protein n=1 Tax=Mycobacterium avium TaxID=1764 RepID=UPI0018C869A6|nr:DUF2398 family protein [Mycobacterium avium]
MTRRITRWPLYVHHRHDDEPSNRATPLCGTQLPHVAMLLADHIAIKGQTGGPGPGWRGMPRVAVLAELTRLAEQQTTGKGGWPAERAADPAGLLTDVQQLLTGVGLLRIVDCCWWLSPVMGRWEPPPTAPAPTPDREFGTKYREVPQVLFRSL